MTVDLTGQYVYVCNNGDNTVSQYAIAAGGVLIPMNPATAPAGVSPQSITVDLAGHYVYVANEGDNTVSVFSIGAGGALTAAGSAGVPTGSGPYFLTTAY